ncbi:RPA49 polymerase, partial [Ptilorrhoa leucosticta]|nr:RPA49 polymerase [Ptilorrhoa leucosticta]
QKKMCIEAFGKKKQKRALSSRQKNAVGNDIKKKAVTKAAANVKKAKGVTGLMKKKAQDDVQNISKKLPPCHEEKKRPEHVYKFEKKIFSSPAEYEALRKKAAALTSEKKEEMAKRAEEKKKSCCPWRGILEELKFLPKKKRSRDHKKKSLWFLDTLIKKNHLKVIKKKNKRPLSAQKKMGPECPHIIKKKLMKNFTKKTYNDGSIQNLISASMKAKITAYVIALALQKNNFQTDLKKKQNDMKLPERKKVILMSPVFLKKMDIAKALRLQKNKAKGVPKKKNDQNHKLGTKKLPLPVQKKKEGQRKRKKMK